ncbi:hypothetical protein [Streptomyces sp. NPDC059979]|uniref:hypothetical protein n=1 Tax=Streptomyces sp. NPDC059979 TaxID=3347021 RepID=UPI0036C0C43A
MSLYPVLWAIDHAPIADAEERAVLVALVVKGDFDGMNCFRSYTTLGNAARVDKKTAGVKCRAMESRGILRRQTSHQSAVWLRMHEEMRPVIWEAMIPAEWWSAEQLKSINEQRANLGRPPITPENRPPLAPAPPKRARVDKGAKRPRKAASTAPAAAPGTSSPQGETDIEGAAPGTSSPHPQGLEVPTPRDLKSPPPGLEVPTPGDLKSPPRGLEVPQPSESPSEGPSQSPSENEPPVRPSVSVGSGVRASETDGRTDGSGGVGEAEPERQQAGPGGPAAADAAPDKSAAAADAAPGGGPAADSPPASDTIGERLLREIGAWHPEFLLTGKTFTDQGRMVTGMLASGWKEATLRQVIVGRPLPEPLTHTVGAIVSGRLKEAAKNLPPSPTATWGPVPAQARAEQYSPVDHSSTAVADRTVEESKNHRVHYECAVCSREPVPGFDLCEDCAELPDCATGCGRRAPDEGEMCDACAKAWAAAGVIAPPTEDGKCPGRGGEPCDGLAQPGTVLGLCGRCRIAAETERRAAAELVDAPF